MNQLITNISEYEQLIDSLVYEPDNDNLRIFIERASLSNYFKGRSELFFIDKVKGFLLNDYLEKFFDVPKAFTGQQIYSSKCNFKLQILLIMIYYGVKYTELSQSMIDEVQDMIPYVSFNKLRNCLFRADSSKFENGSTYRITGTEMVPTDMVKLIYKFLGHMKKNGQRSEAGSLKAPIKRFFVFISEKAYIKSIADITREDIEQYIEFLSITDYNGVTSNKYRSSFVYRHLRALHHFFDYLVDIQDSLKKQDIPRTGLFEKSDFPSPHRRGVKHLPFWADKLIIKRIRLMPEETDEALLDKTIMLLLYYTGVRGSDACTLERDCLFEKLNTNWIRVFSNKTKREYEIPINNELYKYLNACKEKKVGGKLIHPTTRKKTAFLLWKHDGYRTFRRKVDELVKKISNMVKYEAIRQGISIEDINSINITSHKFRHTVAIRLCRMGADPLLIAEMLGHKDLYMAQAYIQEDEEYINEVMNEVLEDEFLNMDGQAIILPNYFDPVSLSLYESKDELFKSKCRIKRCDGGYCVYEGETPPCGSDGDDDCFLCPNLKPEPDDPDYTNRLKWLLLEHKDLHKYDVELRYLGDAKREELIINRIQSFLKEMKENDKKNQE